MRWPPSCAAPTARACRWPIRRPPAAREIRRQIGELVDAGATDAEVRAHFVDRYGEWILLAPTSPAAWILPFAALIAGRRRPGDLARPAATRAGDARGRRRRDSPPTARRGGGARCLRPSCSSPCSSSRGSSCWLRSGVRAHRRPPTRSSMPQRSATASRSRRCGTWRPTGGPARSTSAATPSSLPRPRRAPPRPPPSSTHPRRRPQRHLAPASGPRSLPQPSSASCSSPGRCCRPPASPTRRRPTRVWPPPRRRRPPARRASWRCSTPSPPTRRTPARCPISPTRISPARPATTFSTPPSCSRR